MAKEISVAGGVAKTAQVDALDEQAIEKHAAAVAEKIAMRTQFLTAAAVARHMAKRGSA